MSYADRSHRNVYQHCLIVVLILTLFGTTFGGDQGIKKCAELNEYVSRMMGQFLPQCDLPLF